MLEQFRRDKTCLPAKSRSNNILEMLQQMLREANENGIMSKELREKKKELSNTRVNAPPLGHRKRKWHLHQLKKKHISKKFKNCLIWIQFRLKKPRKLK